MKTVTHRGFKVILDPEDSMGSTLINTGEWEPSVDNWINKYVQEGDIAVDIGAKFGIHTFAFRNAVGKKGEVHSFEPNPYFRSLLRQSIGINDVNNIYLYGDAISNDYRITKYSVIDCRCSNVSYIGEADEMYTVNEAPLSSILNNYDIVKIDVEGSEERIIPTLELSSMKHLIVEFHNDILSNSTIDDLESLLQDNGRIKWNKHRMLWSAK